jgi:hypothetical protein
LEGHDRLLNASDANKGNHKGQQAWQCVGGKHKTAAALLKPGA